MVEVTSKAYKVHRLIWIYHHGAITKGKEINHVNHIRDDNRIENLVLVDVGKGQKNKKLYASNSSGVPGVRLRDNGRKWRASISYNGRRISLGDFDTKRDAIIARKNAEMRYGFHPNHGKTFTMDV